MSVTTPDRGASSLVPYLASYDLGFAFSGFESCKKRCVLKALEVHYPSITYEALIAAWEDQTHGKGADKAAVNQVLQVSGLVLTTPLSREVIRRESQSITFDWVETLQNLFIEDAMARFHEHEWVSEYLPDRVFASSKQVADSGWNHNTNNFACMEKTLEKLMGEDWPDLSIVLFSVKQYVEWIAIDRRAQCHDWVRKQRGGDPQSNRDVSGIVRQLYITASRPEFDAYSEYPGEGVDFDAYSEYLGEGVDFERIERGGVLTRGTEKKLRSAIKRQALRMLMGEDYVEAQAC